MRYQDLDLSSILQINFLLYQDKNFLSLVGGIVLRLLSNKYVKYTIDIQDKSSIITRSPNRLHVTQN